MSGKKSKLEQEDVDEDDYVRQHDKYYGGGRDRDDNERAGSNNLGAAAAMHALKMFTGGSEKGKEQKSQNDFIGVAMAQAAKLYDDQNSKGKTAPDATKQDVVAQAAQMALKLYLKNQMGGGKSSGGSGGSGGGAMGTVMNLASNFLSK